MDFERLNLDWNAEPNVPEPKLFIENGNLIIHFYLNYFLYEKFCETDIGKLTFLNCQKFEFNNMNDEGYYLGKYRYNYQELPWGEFYKIKTDEKDFPKNPKIIESNKNLENLNHYLFFFRDNIFECLAEKYIFDVLKKYKQ